MDGFTGAMDEMPNALEGPLDRADEETRSTIIFLMALQYIHTDNIELTDEDVDEIEVQAPDLIPNCVATILH